MADYRVVWNGTMDRQGTSAIHLSHDGIASGLNPNLTIFEPERHAPGIYYGGGAGIDYDAGFNPCLWWPRKTKG